MSCSLLPGDASPRIKTRFERGLCRWFILLLLLGAWNQRADAFVSNLNDAGQPQKWNYNVGAVPVDTNVFNPTTKAIRYFLGATAFSSAHRDAELNAARACFDQWQAVPGSDLRFEEGGLMTGNPDVNTHDNTNVIFWAKTSTLVNGGLDDISGSTAVTFSDYFSDNSLAESDTVLNGVDYSWFTDFNDTSNPGFFVEAVLLHEIGHLLGLAHSPVGAATMFPRGGPGVSVQAGLSSDEIAAVHALYPLPSVPSTLGRLTGQVKLGGNGVFGAIVVAENGAGNVAAGTITQASGGYDMPGMPPGEYQVRVTPVDAANAAFFLFRGLDVSRAYTTAQTSFAASTNSPVRLNAGQSATLNFAVTSPSLLHIVRIRPPTPDPERIVVVNFPVLLPMDDSEVFVGVYSSDVSDTNAILQVTGDGLTLGRTTFKANAFPGLNPPLNLFSVPIQVAPTATPGMRTFVLQSGASVAYANGFLEVPTPFPDFNFDGLDDRFQRQYFARWTEPDASPTADPDGDGFNNAAEFLSGTDPTNPASVLEVGGIRVDSAGVTISWPAAPNKHYQVFSRSRINSVPGWQPLGLPVLSSGTTAEYQDGSATNGVQFYRIQAVP